MYEKIPTLFERDFSSGSARATPVVKMGFEWVLKGEGIATIKYDGSCCAIIDGEFYRRYDAKHGKPVPEGAIKCQEEADPITGHLPCWVKCDRNNPADKWFWAAYNLFNKYHGKPADKTYEAIGLHFQGNPYNLSYDILMCHGKDVVVVPRSFEGIREWLENHEEEGIVFWRDGKPQCKIKRKDFGIKWNKKGHG